MKTIVWQLPVSSTAFLEPDPVFEIGIRRTITIRFSFEEEDDVRRIELAFAGVEAFKCTHLSALDGTMLEAYDLLVDRGQTDWLTSVQTATAHHGFKTEPLRHLMIMFDDGPCYEIICSAFSASG
jgi:hypothetical protein